MPEIPAVPAGDKVVVEITRRREGRRSEGKVKRSWARPISPEWTCCLLCANIQLPEAFSEKLSGRQPPSLIRSSRMSTKIGGTCDI